MVASELENQPRPTLSDAPLCAWTENISSDMIGVFREAILHALDLRPVSAADTDEACPVAKGHGGRAQQDVLKVAPSGILGIRLG